MDEYAIPSMPPSLFHQDDYVFGVPDLTAFGVYGGMSFIFGLTFPLLWVFVMQSDSQWNTLGYKVNAYIHLLIWGPLAFFWFWSNIFQSLPVYQMVMYSSQFSLLGPFLLYLLPAVYNFIYGVGNDTPE